MEISRYRKTIFVSSIGLLLLLLSCNSKKIDVFGKEAFRQSFLADELNWESVIDSAVKESEVHFYYITANNNVNEWLYNTIIPKMQFEFNITLVLHPVDTIGELIDILLKEKDQETKLGEGVVDLMWINTEDYYILDFYDLFFGAFADKLPQSDNFIWDDMSEEFMYNHSASGIPINYNAIPWSTTIFGTYVNRHYVHFDNQPTSYYELYSWLQLNPGKFTYVSLPNRNGYAFVKSVLLDFNLTDISNKIFQEPVGQYSFMDMADVLYPAFRYIRMIQPLLWRGGESYPNSMLEYETMYQNEEIYIMQKFDKHEVTYEDIEGARVISTEKITLVSSGNLTNKSYLTISSMAKNPAAALVLINELISSYTQLSKYKNTSLGIGTDIDQLKGSRILSNVDIDIDATTGTSISDFHISWNSVIYSLWVEYIEHNSSKPFSMIIKEILDNITYTVYAK